MVARGLSRREAPPGDLAVAATLSKKAVAWPTVLGLKRQQPSRWRTISTATPCACPRTWGGAFQSLGTEERSTLSLRSTASSLPAVLVPSARRSAWGMFCRSRYSRASTILESWLSAWLMTRKKPWSMARGEPSLAGTLSGRWPLAGSSAAVSGARATPRRT